MGGWRRGGGLLGFGGGRVRASRSSRRGRLGLLGFGGGRGEVVVVVVDGGADGLAPGVGAESGDVYELGEENSVHERLGQLDGGAGRTWLYMAWDPAGEGGAPVR